MPIQFRVCRPVADRLVCDESPSGRPDGVAAAMERTDRAGEFRSVHSRQHFRGPVAIVHRSVGRVFRGATVNYCEGDESGLRLTYRNGA